MNNTRILHIVRHGKALQDYRAIEDIDRPLTEKGVTNTVMMANRLNKKYTVPCLIVSSPAARALHTAHIFARVFRYPSDRVQVNDALYMGGENAALDILYALPCSISEVMIVAHNPDMTLLADIFIRPMTLPLPVSGVASVRFAAGEWKDIFGNVAGYEIDYPKT
jgi:phosphohistidine phosphatase